MQLFSNNAKSALSSAISDVATALVVTSGTGTLFNEPTGNEYELVTISDGTNVEIIKLITRSFDNFTVIERAQEGTTARAWDAGATIEGRITKGTINGIINQFGTIDYDGDAKGTDSINIQTTRISTDQVASGEKAIAIGGSSKSSAQESTAIGSGALATANYSVAIGQSANATGTDSIGIGHNVRATGLGAMALQSGLTNTSNSATGDYSIALGYDARASNTNGISIGLDSYVIGSNGIGIGYGAYNTASDSIAIGKSAQSMYPSTWAADTIYAVGDLIKPTASVPNTVHRCISTGTSGSSAPSWSASLLGITTDNTAQWELVLQTGNMTTLSDGVSIGSGSFATTGASTAIGKSAFSIESGVAIGSSAVGGFNSVAIGYASEAKVNRSLAIGYEALSGKPPKWASGVIRNVGDTIVTDSSAIFRITSVSSGSITSNVTEPTWPANKGDTVVETDTGGVKTATWTFVGYFENTSSDATALGSNSITTGGKDIACGNYAIAADNYAASIGYDAVSSWGSTALGSGTRAINDESVAIGLNATASASSGFAGIAIGSNAISSGASSCNVIGDYAVNRISETTVIGGMQLIRKDNSENASYEHLHYTGAQITVLSKEISLKAVADNAATITIPTGATFFIDEVGVIVTSADTVTVQPDVSFGVTGDTVSILASTATTKSVAKGRDVFTPISKDGVNSLTASVKTGATATTLMGRFYWKGILVEDE